MDTTWHTLWPGRILVVFLQSCVAWLGYRLVNDTVGATPRAPPTPGGQSPHSCLYRYVPTGQSESVRDVQFSIRDYFTFASTFENGNVQLWDIRRPDRCERMFTAHNGPVFCCDWHPEDRCGMGRRRAGQ